MMNDLCNGLSTSQNAILTTPLHVKNSKSAERLKSTCQINFHDNARPTCPTPLPVRKQVHVMESKTNMLMC